MVLLSRGDGRSSSGGAVLEMEKCGTTGSHCKGLGGAQERLPFC